MNKLLLGDNLEILKTLESESVDLIYLDPPFFSNRHYEVIWGDKGEIRSFEDRWSGGIDHYIAWLKERVVEMHRVLKATGSLFLHCDWHANAYIRVFILDKIFGEQNFGNEISWIRSNPKSHGSKHFPNCKDTIFRYVKSKKFSFNKIFAAHDDSYVDKAYKYIDEFSGKRYRLLPLLNPNDNRPNLTYEFLGIKRVWRWTKERMEQAYRDGLVVQLKQGAVPQYKLYLEESKGKTITDHWSDILQISAKEEIGYPTQKPEALLERIILCASNENDVILDPFVGGGTTVAVADKLNRNWIGIDQSVQAIKVSELRLQKQQDLFSKPFIVQLHKYDYDTLRYSDAFEFETWIIQQYGGTPNIKQRNDFGLDGYYSPPNHPLTPSLERRENETRGDHSPPSQGGAGGGRIPIQVKRSDNIGRNVIDNFKSACERFDKNLFEKNKSEGKSVGILIAFSFGKGAIQEVARLKNQENLIIELVTVEEIVPIAKKPKLTVKFTDLGLDAKGLREIEFTAIGESDAGIEFYAWDFNFNEQAGFKADILIDKIGKQSFKFKSGEYQIAVKIVDNAGLERLEVITLKINGEKVAK